MATSARLDELKKKFDENPRRYFAPLANEYRKLGDLTQAIALCRAHLPNQPGHISGHIVLAQALYEARELGESRQIFEASLDLDPENLIALRYLGDIAREQGEPVQARGWYERVLDADPRNEDIALLLRELDGPATATADPTESPAYDDLRQDEESGYDSSPSFTPSASFEGLSSGAQPIEPHVVDTGSETPAWGTAATTPPTEDVQAPEELLHDLPAADEALTFFETPASDDVFASTPESVDEDPFFGASDAAGTLESDELPVAESSVEDDWFASASASPEHEGIQELASAEASHFEDSFLPDLAQVTPIDSLVVSEVSDPEAAPTFFDEQEGDFSFDPPLAAADRPAVDTPAPATSGIPTPSFLSAVDESPEPASLPEPVESSEFDVFIASAPTPTPAPFAIPFEGSADDSADFEDAQTIESAASTPEFAGVSAEERDQPTLEVEVTAPLETETVAAADFGSDALIAGFDDVVSWRRSR